jgi:pimeloyl-[acyl-carrier protein] methyl ester esterase
MKLLLLPGMDGTGELFVDFVNALPNTFSTKTVRYPPDQRLSYVELASLVQSAVPVSEPFVLLAESFSTPLAIQCAASNPPNLKGLVICAGFATSPVRGALRFLGSLASPILFRAGLPGFAARLFLIGSNAPSSLLAALIAAVSSVQPEVLSARVHEVFSCDARSALDKVAVPILYVKAKQDRLVHTWCVEEIRRIKPQVSVSTIVGPHLLLQREPRRTAEAVAEFVQGLICKTKG